MPRQARVQSPTDYYHVMMRGNNRENIFTKDIEKRFFLNSLQSNQEEGLLEIAAYCIMDNHVHIVVKADITNLPKAIKSINTKFAFSFNQVHGRIGHVFQDRYKSEAITDDTYLLQVIRYIHNNPVKARMVQSQEDYNWSSYNEYTNENGLIDRSQKEFIVGCFNDNLNKFVEFHKQKNNDEFLEIKEDLEAERFEKGQEIIAEYFQHKGLVHGKQVLKNAVMLEEIINKILKESRLTHRQVANLLGISNSVVHRSNLKED